MKNLTDFIDATARIILSENTDCDDCLEEGTFIAFRNLPGNVKKHANKLLQKAMESGNLLVFNPVQNILKVIPPSDMDDEVSRGSMVVESTQEEFEILDEVQAKVKWKVDASGRRKKVLKCPRGYKKKGRQCIKITGKEKTRRSRSAKKAARSRKGKASTIKRKASQAKKKRKSFGL